MPADHFVVAIQTHDQVGNRAKGERLSVLVSFEALKLGAALLLFSPYVPLLFMGEEFGARTPFQFFCDFGPELAAAVTRGRRGEFERFASFAREIPDPNDPATFLASKLKWLERNPRRIALVRELLSARRRHLIPRLAGARSGTFSIREGTLNVAWPLADGARWHMSYRPGGGAAMPAGEAVYRSAALAVALEAA